MLINLLLMLTPLSWGSVWTVSSSGGDFSSIQDAINAADDGDQIEVDAGTWAESLNLSGKDLQIVGVPGETILVPDGTAVRWGQAESGSLEGFVIQAGGEQGFVIVGGSPHLEQILIEDAGSGTESGGALQIQGGSPSLTDVTIQNPSGVQGGGYLVAV